VTGREERYIGRFAPSPTGPLHLGSLVAALGSFLQARTRDGLWYVRIEDIDPPREQKGAVDAILSALEWHGLAWDGEVVFQSARLDQYRDALETLIDRDLAYPCTCTRGEIKAHNLETTGSATTIYPGLCRGGPRRAGRRRAWRLRVPDQAIEFTDLEAGVVRQDLRGHAGDFVLRRRDGLYAYQLAVVVDDAAQGITEVVRGLDLLDSTPGQIVLQHFLEFPTPDYLHLPLVMAPGGVKLSKQTGARGLREDEAAGSLVAALEFLGIDPPPDMRNAAVDDLIAWGISRWPVRRDGPLAGDR